MCGVKNKQIRVHQPGSLIELGACRGASSREASYGPRLVDEYSPSIEGAGEERVVSVGRGKEKQPCAVNSDAQCKRVKGP